MSSTSTRQRLSPCDLVLVEGFKSAAIPKLEVYRASVGKSMLHPRDKNIVAVATDGPLATTLPLFDLGDVTPIAAFIIAHAESRGSV